LFRPAEQAPENAHAQALVRKIGSPSLPVNFGR
jgi:hypothetical protein